MRKPVSIAETVAAASRFFARRLPAIVLRSVVPLGLGWCVLFVALNAYLNELSIFLRRPSMQVGSLALGLIAAGFLITLFLHAVLIAAITELALETDPRRWRMFRAGLPEWRLFAAYLRLILVYAGLIFVAAMAGWALAIVAGQMGTLSRTGGPLFDAVAVLAILAVAVRVGFLLAPVTIAEHGPVLRRAMDLSRGIGLRILVASLCLIAPGIVVQLACEGAARAMRLLPPISSSASFATLVDTLRAILPVFLTISAASYFVTAVLFCAASVAVYRAQAENGMRE